jgi:hypothetical protein
MKAFLFCSLKTSRYYSVKRHCAQNEKVRHSRRVIPVWKSSAPRSYVGSLDLSMFALISPPSNRHMMMVRAAYAGIRSEARPAEMIDVSSVAQDSSADGS